MRCAIGVAAMTILSAASASSVRAQERVDSSYHLSGSGVIRRPPTRIFADREYILLRGAPADGRCHYPQPPWGAYRAERVVESDDAHCLQIISLGVYLGNPPLGPNEHMSISTFEFKTDSTRVRRDSARRDSARRDTVPRKPFSRAH